MPTPGGSVRPVGSRLPLDYARDTGATFRFAHSPGRLDRAWLGNLVALDVAFVLELEDGNQGSSAS